MRAFLALVVGFGLVLFGLWNVALVTGLIDGSLADRRRSRHDDSSMSTFKGILSVGCGRSVGRVL